MMMSSDLRKMARSYRQNKGATVILYNFDNWEGIGDHPEMCKMWIYLTDRQLQNIQRYRNQPVEIRLSRAQLDRVYHSRSEWIPAHGW